VGDKDMREGIGISWCCCWSMGVIDIIRVLVAGEDAASVSCLASNWVVRSLL